MHVSSHVWAFVVSLVCLLPLFSRFYFLSQCHLFSVLLINFHVVETAGNKTTALTHSEEYCPVAIHNPLTGYEPPPRQLRLLTDFCSDLPGWIRRHGYGAFVLVRCGTRRWDYGKSLSSPLLFRSENMKKVCCTHKYGETRIRTQFVSKTEMRWRHGKRKIQDSPWKTKRSNSRWSQNWVPEARISSRFW